MVRIIVVTSLCQKLSHLVLPVDVAGLTVVLAAERPLARPLARLRDGWCVCVCVRVMIKGTETVQFTAYIASPKCGTNSGPMMTHAGYIFQRHSQQCLLTSETTSLKYTHTYIDVVSRPTLYLLQ